MLGLDILPHSTLRTVAQKRTKSLSLTSLRQSCLNCEKNKKRRLISQDALTVLYYGLVQSHLTYGLLAWGSANKTNMQSLQVGLLQNKIISRPTIFGVRRNERVASNILYFNLKILKIEELYFLEVAKFM